MTTRMTRRARAQCSLAAVVSFAVLAAGACSSRSGSGGGRGAVPEGGGGVESDAGSGPPEAGLPAVLDGIAADAEVRPFARWSVPGVRLYSASQVEPDLSTARVVGVDDDTGALVEGAELLRRGGTVAPDELARRVFGALLGQAFREPLRPDDEHSWFASEVEWSLVQPAHVEEGTLVFFATRGDMSPDLVEYRVDLAAFEVATRSAEEILVARGETVVLSQPLCIPIAPCGCWEGCARAEQVRLAGRDVATVRLLDGPRAGTILERRRTCTGDRCFSVCPVDLPQANCADAYLFVSEPCTESCPPSEAPFHCDTYADRCERVEHPVRAGARAERPVPASRHDPRFGRLGRVPWASASLPVPPAM